MNTQTLKNSANLCNFSFALMATDLLPTRPDQISSRDYGFDFDEGELAEELLAALHAGGDQATLSLDAEDFCNLWFLA
jgi:hypothetical protein